MFGLSRDEDGEQRIGPGKLSGAICALGVCLLVLWGWRVSLQKASATRNEMARIYSLVTNEAIKQLKRSDIRGIAPVEQLKVSQDRAGSMTYLGWIEFGVSTNVIRKWFAVDIREDSLTNAVPDVWGQIYETEPRK